MICQLEEISDLTLFFFNAYTVWPQSVISAELLMILKTDILLRKTIFKTTEIN